MASLYVLGARQRKSLMKHEEEWNLYDAALILEVDPETGRAVTRVEYKSPEEARASQNSSVVFKSATLVGNTLYACTSTEVLIFELPTFRRIGYISLPCFNDVHHVMPMSDGSLVAVSTGLDMVFKFTCRGEMLAEWCVLDEIPWSRFSRTVDYRKVDSTKPHKSHPNFAFELEGELWVTRFRQRDAICLTKPGKRIEIVVESPHDGLLRGDRIYFTTVDGRVVIANSHTQQVEQIIDLKELSDPDALLGWCRGLCPLDERKVWVGFTRVRRTQFMENVLWIRKVLHDGTFNKPTHIGLYDIVDKRCLQEIDLEPYGMNIIFSIFPVGARASACHPVKRFSASGIINATCAKLLATLNPRKSNCVLAGI